MMSYKRRLLGYDHLRGVLPAFAGELNPKPRNEPDSGMELPPTPSPEDRLSIDYLPA